MIRRLLACAALAALAPSGCGNAPPDAAQGPVVAVVAGTPIPVALVLADPALDAGDRRQGVERAVARRLAAEEARRRGLGGESPSPSEPAAALAAESRLRDALFERIRDEMELPPDAVERHYRVIGDRFREREVRVRLEPYPSRSAARLAVAQPPVTPPVGSRTLGPAPPARLPAAALPQAATLERVGQRAVVGGPDGWGVVELLEVAPAALPELAQVRERVEASLRLRLGQQAFHELLARLRAEQHVAIDAGILNDDSLWSRHAGAS